MVIKDKNSVHGVPLLYMQEQTNTNVQLQPQSGASVQPGQSSLQPQGTGGVTQSQSTGQPQQDVLGSQDYKSFDGLKVQGAPTDNMLIGQSSGGGSLWLLILIIFLLASFAALVFKKYKSTKSYSHDAIDSEAIIINTTPQPNNSVVKPDTHDKPANKIANKSASKNKNKVIKKSKAKAKKKR